MKDISKVGLPARTMLHYRCLAVLKTTPHCYCGILNTGFAREPLAVASGHNAWKISELIAFVEVQLRAGRCFQGIRLTSRLL